MAVGPVRGSSHTWRRGTTPVTVAYVDSEFNLIWALVVDETDKGTNLQTYILDGGH